MIRTLVVDDEPPARAKLVGLLRREADIEVVGEAGTGLEAVEAIAEHAPDLVLLDIQMPGLDGFGVIETIGVEAMPATIFVTAYDEYALQAFEVHALDYLLKPFAPERLAAALGRLRQRLRDRPDDTALASLLDQAPVREPLERILVEVAPNHQQLIRVEDVLVFRSRRNDVLVVTEGGSHRRRGTLARLERRLDPARFLRVNRSEIVRLDTVGEIQPWFHGDARIVLTSGEVLTWSRRYRARDRHRFEW